jgi:hypothetical protein
MKTLVTDGFYNGARRSLLARLRMSMEEARSWLVR